MAELKSALVQKGSPKKNKRVTLEAPVKPEEAGTLLEWGAPGLFGGKENVTLCHTRSRKWLPHPSKTCKNKQIPDTQKRHNIQNQRHQPKLHENPPDSERIPENPPLSGWLSSLRNPKEEGALTVITEMPGEIKVPKLLEKECDLVST